MEINLPDKLYYSIGEVAKAFGVNTSLIRFWEKEFAIISPRKSTTGSRKFTPEDVKKLQLIYHLVQKTLSNYDLISKLQHIKQTLIAIKNALE